MLRLKSRMRNRLTSGVFAVRMEHMTNRKRQKSEIPGGDKLSAPDQLKKKRLTRQIRRGGAGRCRMLPGEVGLRVRRRHDTGLVY